MDKRVLVITSKYNHHSEFGGYIQLSKFTKPTYIIGIDETSKKKPLYFLRAYKWLYEFIGWWKYRNKIDILHIYYGEEYYRFSAFLFRKIPIIVTYHQPPEKLIEEITTGGDGGRIYRFAHRLTKKRFEKLAAAIVLEENQKEILKKVIPENKIHVIYHGVYLKPKNHNYKFNRDNNLIISIGNWLRDWNFFENILKEALTQFPGVTFKLVNKKIDLKILQKLNKYNNFKYESDVTDYQLAKLLNTAKFLFLPLKSAAGNNAVMEGLALGTPILLPDIFNAKFQLKCAATQSYQPENINDCILKIKALLNADSTENERMEKEAKNLIKKFSWKEIAKKTSIIYNKSIKSKRDI